MTYWSVLQEIYVSTVSEWVAISYKSRKAKIRAAGFEYFTHT